MSVRPRPPLLLPSPLPLTPALSKGVVQSLYAVLRARGHDPAPLDPWYFPSASEYRKVSSSPPLPTVPDHASHKVLESAGFAVHTIGLHPRLTPLHGPLADWLELFARPTMLAGLPDSEAAEAVRDVQDMCARDCRDADGNWAIMYCRLRFSAEKPQAQ